MVKVSVITPCYNAEPFIERCLESLVSQTLDNIEIICINNASEDNSIDILQRYEQQYKDKVFVLELDENMGPGGARNEGVIRARGEYLGFVDADDWVEPDMFECMYNAASQRNADIISCNFCQPSTRDFVATDRGSGEITGGKLTDSDRSECIMTEGVMPWYRIYRREFFLENELMFIPNLHYDDMLWAQLVMAYVQSMYHCDRMFYYNYQHTDSICSTKNSDRHYEWLLHYPWIVKEAKARGIYERYRDAFDFRSGLAHYDMPMRAFVSRMDEVNLDKIYALRLYMYYNHPKWRINPHLGRCFDENYNNVKFSLMDTDPRLAFIYYKIIR